MSTVYQPSQQQLKAEAGPKYALRLALSRLAGDISITALYIYLAFQAGAWQLTTMAAAAAKWPATVLLVLLIPTLMFVLNPPNVCLKVGANQNQFWR